MSKTKSINNQSGLHSGYVIMCPACKSWHLLDHRWSFNGDIKLPTFTPSLLVRTGFNKKDIPAKVCHSYITDGSIRFLADCTHDLAGQTVILPDVDTDSDSLDDDGGACGGDEDE